MRIGDPIAMLPARCHSLALAAVLCGAGPVVADESDSLWLNPLLDPERTTQQELSQPVSRTELDLAHFFGGEALSWGNGRILMPFRHEEWSLDSQRSLFANALAIEWQHNVNADNLVTLSARYDNSLDSNAELPRASGTAATLSWSGLFAGDSRVSGKLFVGDQDARERRAGNGERRFYGLQLEGRYTLWRDHAPFASLQWQRNNYDVIDAIVQGGSLLRQENISRFAAGWNWQVSPSWDMRAEANYRLADDNTADAPELDRTQLYFSTRYGFR
jgi:hypothetical protein